jgi:hypothetical protein
MSPRQAFLLTTVSGTALYTTTITSSVINLSTEPTETASDLSQNVSVSANTLLRDMGRSVTMFVNVASRAMKVAVFREVQLVSGDLTEGVSDVTRLLVPVWVDNQAVQAPFAETLHVQVARCG